VKPETRGVRVRNSVALYGSKKAMLLVFLAFFIFLTSTASASQLMALHGKATDSGSAISSGNLRVFIYTASSGGTLVYDSVSDFNGTVLNGIFDVILGSGSNTLDLNYGTHYFLDLQVNSTNLDFNGNGREEFEASRGTVYSTSIANETITNSDIAQNAAIDWNKISKIGADLNNFNWGSDFNNTYARRASDVNVTGNWNFGTLSTQTTFGGGFGSNGITMQNGVLYTQSIVIVNDFNAATITAIDINGHYTPSINNTFDLGSASFRWRAIYTQDINSVTGSIGTLTLGNALGVSSGGTGSTSFSSGRVPFSNGTILTSDGNFFWDNSLRRLGIGTSSPAAALNVIGDANIVGDLNVSNGITWTMLKDYPAACTSGQFVTTIGDTLTCTTVPGGGGGRIYTGQSPISIDNDLNTVALNVLTTSDWNGLFDGQQGTYYLNWANDTNRLFSLLTLDDNGSFDGRYIKISDTNNAARVAYTALGGTSAGGILFGAAGSVAQDGNLFWDSSADRLGLKTGTPANTLNVVGDLNVSTSATDARPAFYVRSTDGNVGINTAGGAGYRLDVNGNSRFTDVNIFGDLNAALTWVALKDYPAACGAGQFVTTIGDTVTCAAPTGSALLTPAYNVTADGNSTFGAGNYIFPSDLNVHGRLNANTLASRDNNALSIQTQNTTRLTIGSTGLIGIGNTSPQNTLSIIGDFNIAASATARPSLYIRSTDGNIGINTDGGTGYRLDVNGNAKIRGDLNVSGLICNDVNCYTLADLNTVFGIVSSQWTTSGANIYYNTGNVGINNSSPANKLSIIGDLNIATAAGAVAPSLYVNSSDGNVSIGTRTPAYKLDVNGNTRLSNPGGIHATAFIINATSTDTTKVFQVDRNGSVGIGGSAFTGVPSGGQGELDVSYGGSPASIIVGAESSLTTRTDSTNKIARIAVPHFSATEEPAAIVSYSTTATQNTLSLGGGTSTLNAATLLSFYTASAFNTLTGTERMRIDSSGNVGIGTTSPAQVFDVNALSTRLTFSSTGLGVGTTNPANKLNVVGDLNVSTSATDARPALYVRSTDGNVGINTVGGAGYRLDVNGNSRIIGDLNVTGATTIGSLAGFVRDAVFNAAFPVADANVADDITATNYVRNTIFNAFYPVNYDTNVTNKPFIPSTAAWDTNFAQRGAFDSNAVLDTRYSKITDTNNGFVTNTTFNAAWPVNDANIANNITIKSSNDANFYNGLTSNRVFSVDNNTLTLGTNNAARMTIGTDGNIGINTTGGTGYRLDVNGNTNITTLVVNGTAPSQFSGVIYPISIYRADGSSDGSGILFRNQSGLPSGAIYNTGSPTLSQLCFDPYYNNKAIGCAISFGAGATGDANFVPITVGTTNGTIDSNIFIYNTVQNTVQNNIILGNLDTGTSQGSRVLFRTANTAGGIVDSAGIWSLDTAKSGAGSTTAIVFGTANDTNAMTERVRIAGDGNFGIGISTPIRKLDVNGSSLFRGDVNINTNRICNDANCYLLADLNGTGNVSSQWTTSGSNIYFPSSTGAAGNVGIGVTSPDSKLDINGVLDFEIPTTQTLYITHADTNFIQLNTPLQSTFVGAIAGGSLQSGYSSLTGIGYDALGDVNTGSYNTALGTSAGATITESSNNTAIGAWSMRLSVPTAANGNNTGVGYSTLMNNTGSGNTAVGASALSGNTLGASNVAVGASALGVNSSGSHNIAIGANALNGTTTGTENVGIGSNTLNNSTTGASNVAVGYAAVYTNSTGTSNTGVGYESMRYNDGNSNTALGFDAGLGVSGSSYYIRNTLIGYRSGIALRLGYDNTFVGYNSGVADTNGFQNTTLGASSGTGLTLGANNVLLGYDTGSNLITGNRNIIIGSDVHARAADSNNTINIGNIIFGINANATGTTIDTDANIGIGVASPTAKLTVSGDINLTTGRICNDANCYFLADLNSGGGSASQWTTSDSNIYYNSGNVGIGTASPTKLLSLNASPDTNGVGAAIAFKRADESNYGAGIWNASNGVADYLKFGVGSNADPFSDAQTHMTILATGNIGMGTLKPSNRLNVIGDFNVITSATAAKPSLFIDSTDGNVGIGRAAPNSVLVISGQIANAETNFMSGEYTQLYIRDSDAGDNNSGLRIGYMFRAGVEEYARIQAHSSSNGIAVGTNLALNPNGGNVGIAVARPKNKLNVIGDLNVLTSLTAAPSLYVNSTDGNVGIGTASPVARLNVAGSNPQIRVDDNASGVSSLFISSTSVTVQGLRLRYDVSTGISYIDTAWNDNSGHLYFRTKTSGTPVNAMAIIGDGNVGVNTTTPKNKLNVIGDLNVATAGNVTPSILTSQTTGRTQIGRDLNVSSNTANNVGVSISSDANRICFPANTCEMKIDYNGTAIVIGG